jgi:hypothetical protein
MPNWVTNKVKTSKHVLESILNEEGNIDFNKIVAFEGHFPWDGIMMNAESLAEAVINKPLSDFAPLKAMQWDNRQKQSINDLNDEGFEQFMQMLRNYRKTGYLHMMDFARDKWGTKWNAGDCVVKLEEGTASFDTAWSCPEPIFVELSKKFPDEVIEVTYADEDVGSNCGTFILKNGEAISSDIAPRWDNQSDEEKAKWKAFAYAVKGWDPKDYEEDEEEE